MKNESKQMYFKISDSGSVAQLDNALKPIHAFDEKLYALQQQYRADTPFVFNSLDRGLDFSCLWFKEFPHHLDTKTEFKVSPNKEKTGYDVRPRKSNKKFYSEFIKDLENVHYEALKLALFGNTDGRSGIEYLKKDQEYFVSSSANIILPNIELTFTEYSNSVQ